MTADREEKIRRRAYELWEAEGRPVGRQADHWERAAREVDAEEDEGRSAGAGDEPGLSSSLQPGGTTPGASPATGEGSIGTGGGSTAGRRSGAAKREKSPSRAKATAKTAKK